MLLKVSEVARRLNCSVSTVYGLIERELLPYHRCPGIRVSEEQINAYLDGVRHGPVTRREKSRPVCRPRLRDLAMD